MIFANAHGVNISLAILLDISFISDSSSITTLNSLDFPDLLDPFDLFDSLDFFEKTDDLLLFTNKYFFFSFLSFSSLHSLNLFLNLFFTSKV